MGYLMEEMGTKLLAYRLGKIASELNKFLNENLEYVRPVAQGVGELKDIVKLLKSTEGL